jgi:uncharacterized DUF497 family protein
MEYRFEWNPTKARTNRAKHGVSFLQGTTVFRDPNALTMHDERHSVDEDRWITLGISQSCVLMVIIHTYEETGQDVVDIRLISARRATRREKVTYETQ